MMHTIVRIKDQAPCFYRAKIWPHPDIASDICHVSLEIGDDEIDLSFDHADDMIDFCEKHNIPYQDKRTKVDKYLSRKRREAAL